MRCKGKRVRKKKEKTSAASAGCAAAVVFGTTERLPVTQRPTFTENSIVRSRGNMMSQMFHKLHNKLTVH